VAVTCFQLSAIVLTMMELQSDPEIVVRLELLLGPLISVIVVQLVFLPFMVVYCRRLYRALKPQQFIHISHSPVKIGVTLASFFFFSQPQKRLLTSVSFFLGFFLAAYSDYLIFSILLELIAFVTALDIMLYVTIAQNSMMTIGVASFGMVGCLAFPFIVNDLVSPPISRPFGTLRSPSRDFTAEQGEQILSSRLRAVAAPLVRLRGLLALFPARSL